MKSWLNPKLFAGAVLLMTLQQALKLNNSEVSLELLATAALTVLLGGLFWGIIATFISIRFIKK